ncbi:hypothetical protein AB0I61_05440 [Polymorphospora rubra]|uniref:hypothetical protein n=1 Tax=Polymorphospora rubra TaxID=338584 RepID=UPI0033E31781
MKDRWVPIGLLAGALFLVNVVARLVTRFGFDANPEVEDRVSLGMFAVIAVILAVLAFIWGRQHPLSRWGADLAGAVLIALALTVFVGPLVSGSYPFANGAGSFFSQIWLYAAFTFGGTVVGYLVLIALGRDHRSRSLQQYSEAKLAKPRRVVRR